MSTKTRNIIGWVLTALLSALFIMSAFMKLSGNAEAIKNSAAMGVSADTLKLIGVIEISSLILFIIPRTGVLGSLLLVAYMGGAIATHLEHQMPVYMPVIISAVLWITALIRFPELGRRLFGTSTVSSV